MSGTSSNRILSIYKSRTNILNHMKRLGYNVEDYEQFSINEVDAMFVSSQLDMLLTHPVDNNRVYIKYYIPNVVRTTGSRQINKQVLDAFIEDLYEYDTVLTKKDTLVIIMDEEPNETIVNRMKYLYEHNGIFVVIHNIKRLQFDILSHTLVPKTKILKDLEAKELQVVLNMKDLKQLPEISRFDPVSLVLNLRPGQVIECERNSATALNTKYYRICV
jgi:DNA-directed RNA polymerase subunit H (RpoH/RPB5)